MKATFNNNPNARAKSRIMYDIKNIEKNQENLNNQEGIYFKFNVDGNIFSTKYSMLIIGPSDSPYVGGFYLFDSQFPDQYPFIPMKMTSITQGGNIRKHPNLYICGKCCFSFLGTWAGPPWTACQNPTTVGISMRSVLTNNPINNEPGWEKKNTPATKLYETLIRYFNIRYAVIEILKKLSVSNKYSPFRNAIVAVFKKNYDVYKNEIKKFKYLDGTEIKSPVYNFTVQIDCGSLHKDLDYLYNSFNETDDKPINIISKPTRKAPEKPATAYNTGIIMKGLDGRSWKVKEYTNGAKRWVLDK
tara:strand:+ start:228 stop:1133 length:906 start_codon:yes stop_codon:yes gene_type:complete